MLKANGEQGQFGPQHDMHFLLIITWDAKLPNYFDKIDITIADTIR